MTRLSLALLLAPALASRVAVHDNSEAGSFEHLSSEDSLAANNALDILAQLKIDSTNLKLQDQYKEVIGEIAWEEDRAFLATGMSNSQTPMMLGEQSTPGSALSLVELLSGRVGSLPEITTRIGRFFTQRRDFAIEDVGGGESKYMIDGITNSLHSRMQISMPNEVNPRFVVRRAFNYLNPVASTIGQYIYRVIRCTEEQGGWSGGCREGEMLYTITKDRFGRGALWGQDEYRVYTGTGGCSRHGQGLLSCSSDLQIMYSLSAGLSSGTHDTNFYAGNIRAIDGDFDSGRLHNGEELDAQGLSNMRVATVTKTHGSSRILNWPQQTAQAAATVGFAATGAQLASLANTLTESQVLVVVNHLTYLTPGNVGLPAIEGIAASLPTAAVFTGQQTGLLVGSFGTAGISLAAQQAMMVLAWTYHIAKSLVWADAYAVVFDGNGGSTDELLVSVVAAVQDLTREQVAGVSVGGTANLLR